jgi:hypothetical protein
MMKAGSSLEILFETGVMEVDGPNAETMAL